jgi:Adenylate and Guanylate cyclase catalytic domain
MMTVTGRPRASSVRVVKCSDTGARASPGRSSARRVLRRVAGVDVVVGRVRESQARKCFGVGGPMSTETVTVLFTDLVGSTALASRLGTRQAEVLRRDHFGMLREAIAAHGGREVKNLGDGLMVVFGSLSAGVDAAVDMQQRVEWRNRGADEALSIRVGLSHGEADSNHDGPMNIECRRHLRRCLLPQPCAALNVRKQNDTPATTHCHAQQDLDASSALVHADAVDRDVVDQTIDIEVHNRCV